MKAPSWHKPIESMRRRSPPHRASRSGLAPLELTLALPLLLMLMALMVLIGTAGAWKVRTLANSRQAVFRAMWPRTGAGDPKPANFWPESGALSYGDFDPSVFSTDPYGEHVVVRGPAVTDPSTGYSLSVLIDTLDMTDGLRTGQARIDHDPAMWPALGERNHFRRDTLIFAGNQWQHNEMGFSNGARRVPHTYNYDLARYDAAATQRMRVAQAQLLNNPNRSALDVLDRDTELRDWYGDPYTPYSQDQYDFLSAYPPARRGCTADPVEMLVDIVEPLFAQIQDVPRELAGMFLEMYDEQLQLLEDMDPPPPDYNQQRARLQQLIGQLRQFLGTLP